MGDYWVLIPVCMSVSALSLKTMRQTDLFFGKAEIMD